MKNIFTSIGLLFIGLTFAQNGAPATPYYNGFNFNQTGTALKNALATKITTTHVNNLTYSQVWNALKIVDLDPTNSSNVLLVYGYENGTDGDITNDRTRDKNINGGAVGDWNREHIFAQSLANPDLGQIGPGADAQMLRACDVQKNGERGNKLYTVGSGNAASVGSNGWYPGDEWKGDCARIIMYMYLRYGNQCLPTYVSLGSTVATDANMTNILLQWNAEDPVSQNEDTRNTYLGNASNAYGQGNRNPFIDNPYLATVIWGGPIAQNRWPSVFLANTTFDNLTDVSLYPNPSNNGTITIKSNSEIDSLEIISINGQIVKSIKNPKFVNDSFAIDNLENGFFFLKLSSKNQSTTKKIIIN